MERKGFMAIAIIIIAVAVLAAAAGIWYYEMHQALAPVQLQPIVLDQSWIGHYTFSEYAPPNETWGYDLTIVDGSSSPSAILDINGFQTQILLTASAQAESSGILGVFFKNDNGSQPPLSYSVGDLLFSLTRTKSGLAVIWAKLQPMLKQDISGAVFVLATEPTSTLQKHAQP